MRLRYCLDLTPVDVHGIATCALIAETHWQSFLLILKTLEMDD